MSALLDFRVRMPLDTFELDVEVQTNTRRLGLFGPSGAGKTSVLECLAGWRRPRQGHARVRQRELFDLGAGRWVHKRRRGVGYLPQDVLLFPHWTVMENVTAGVRRNTARREDGLVERACGVLDIEPLLDRSVTSLSGGERQRVALARALCSAPDLLLLDEPLGALDLPLRRRILPYLIRVRDAFEVPMIVVSHDPTEIKALCGEVGVIERGSIAELGRPSSVLSGEGGGVDPLARLENVLGGVVTSCEGGVARVELAGRVEIRLPSAGLNEQERVLFGVRAKDILISTTRPSGLSARNVLAARVEGMAERGDDVQLSMRLLGNGGASEVMQVELTVNAARELDLARGKNAFLVIKAHAFAVLSALEETTR